MYYLFVDTRRCHTSLEIPKNSVFLWHSALVYREEQTRAAWANRDSAAQNHWANPTWGKSSEVGEDLLLDCTSVFQILVEEVAHWPETQQSTAESENVKIFSCIKPLSVLRFDVDRDITK